MASKWAARLGHSFGRLGTGLQAAPIPAPKPIPVNYTNFRSGLLVADRPEDIPEGFYSLAVDVETSRRDGVIRAPGVTLIEDTGSSLQWMAIHTSLDFQSVLVAFAPPLLGVREAGSFEWTNWALPAGDFWVTSRYGDILLFSNGSRSYARNYNTGLVAEVPDMPGAATLFTAFGRVFAGGVVADGQYNVMGLMWTGLTGDYTDWTGDGSGNELLIADVEQTDKIVAGRILSYDLVTILCRRSLWIGARTQDIARPADFQFRLSGVGCVAEPTARSTEGGVTFLSDEGVRHFDANTAPIISGAINSELLPLDFENIALYKAAWDSTRRRYILGTPKGTYIYQFKTAEYPNGAWFKRSITPTNIIVFGQQTVDLAWEDLGDATWDDFGEQTWFQLATPESNEAPDILFADGTRYGFQDETAEANFGAALNSLCQPRPDQRQAVTLADQVISTQSFLVEYIGSGTIQIFAEDELGAVSLVTEAVLAPKTKPYFTTLSVISSSRAVGIYVKIKEGFPEILSIQQTVQENGPVLDDAQDPDVFTETADTYLFTESDSETILWE